MPYVNADIKQKLTNRIKVPTTKGELTYLLTREVQTYLLFNGRSFNTIGDVVAALECAKLELYRRVAAPYEDRKCAENGDVYPPSLL